MLRRIQHNKIHFFLFLLLLSASLWGCNTELKRARLLESKKDFKQAVQFFELALKKDPENDDLWKTTAKIYCEKLNISSRCKKKSEVLYERYPKDGTFRKWYKKSLYVNTRDIYMAKQLKLASREFGKYIKLDPENGKVHFMLANIKFRQNRLPPRDHRVLALALKDYDKALKFTKSTDELTVLNPRDKRIIHYASYMQKGRIFEVFILKEFVKWQKKMRKEAMEEAKRKAKEAKEKPKRRRRRRRAKQEQPKPKPWFKPNSEHFEKAMACYLGASKINHPNKFNRALPYIQMGLFYARFKRDYPTAIKWLKKAKEQDNLNMSAISNLKQLYDRLKDQADEAKDKKLARKYELEANKYDSEMASILGKQ